MRIPYQGSEFELKGTKFEIIKSSGFRITAKGEMEKLDIFNRGDKFTLHGTKFSITGFKYCNPIATIYATANPQ